MDIRSLRPAKEFAQTFGVKSIIYGDAGSGKTPLINTCPRPVMLACEPGLLSMRNSNVPTWLGFDIKAIEDFFSWFFNSAETKNFDTLAVDSTSQMADIYLQGALKSNKHGLAAYGQMATETIKHLRTLYYTREKHIYLIAKQVTQENGFRKPYWPGQQLNADIPYLYDEILHLGIHNIPGMGQLKSFQCVGTIDVLARDRTGSLAEYEEPHFGKLVIKAMQ
jgi:hypothetical protein